MITKDEIHKLSELARIRIDDEEQIGEKISGIIDYIDLLREVDTEGVPECTHVIEGVTIELRDDSEGEPLTTFLDNVPDQVGGMVRVPPVIQQ